MNCSGKHAGMLATCVVNGWDTANYRDPDHPLQVAIRETFEELTGGPVVAVAVDGCGAPLLSCSLTGLARAFRTLAMAQDGPEHRVAEAIRRQPAWVSGTTRDELALLDRGAGCDRQGGGGVLLRGGAAGRAVVRAEGRRRGRAGAAGADGGGVASGGGRRPSRGWTARRCGVPESSSCSGVGCRSAPCGLASRRLLLSAVGVDVRARWWRPGRQRAHESVVGEHVGSGGGAVAGGGADAEVTAAGGARRGVRWR